MSYTPSRKPNINIWGSRLDGNLLFDGVSPVLVDGTSITPTAGPLYTLTRDVFANVLTISPGVTIRTNGFCIRCLELIGDATTLIHDNGEDASSILPGQELSNAPTSLRTTGGGGTRVTTDSNGTNSTGSPVVRSFGGSGGAGGALGIRTGGTGGVCTPPAPPNYMPDEPLAMICTRPSDQGGIGYNGGAGGGGGASNGAGTSGSGGGGGGTVWVFAATCNYAGGIQARGGNGSAGVSGNASGGGGGGGGMVRMHSRYYALTPVISVAGGTGGAGIGTGLSGADGSPGASYMVTLRR